MHMLGLIKSSPSIMIPINTQLVTIDFQVFETRFDLKCLKIYMDNSSSSQSKTHYGNLTIMVYVRTYLFVLLENNFRRVQFVLLKLLLLIMTGLNFLIL